MASRNEERRGSTQTEVDVENAAAVATIQQVKTEDEFPSFKRVILIMPAISSLFFVRLSAVYSHDKYIITFFGSCLLAVLGFFVFDTTSVLSQYSDTGSSQQCFVTGHPDAWGYIATAMYDTLMYLAISWRLASFATTNCWKLRVRSFVTG